MAVTRRTRSSSHTKATKRGTQPLAIVVCTLLMCLAAGRAAWAQEPPELTQPVNDFAGVIDPASKEAMDSLIRSLQQATGDAVVVATVNGVAPYADIREYAVKMFENHGKGIGQRGKDNGLLVIVAVMDRQVWVEVGYDLEEFITDGYAGETSREMMVPEFRRGNYGAGLLAGVSRIIGRIADRRNVSLQGIRPSPDVRARDRSNGGGILVIFIIFILFNVIAGRLRRTRRRYRRWGGGGWSGWNSGIGPFGGGGFGGRGGGFGGGFGGFGGGGGGGFGGFGGGRSGGGGGGAGW